MGGTKCCFRDCPVGSSRNPSMHFFKFPVKDPKRLKDWVRNCSNPDVLNAPPSKLAAKTVCARHFRAECFMNYKMDRLIPMQTPTLFRINRDLALDYADLDQNGEALLVKLTPPKQQHLIPPKDFECPLGFVDGETQNVEVVKKRNTVELTEEEEQRKGKDEADEVSGNLHVLGTEQEQAVVPKEKATAANKSSSSTSASAMPQNILDIISQLQPSLGIKLIKRPVKSQPGSENELPQLEEQLPKEQTDEQTTKESEKHNKSTSCIIDVYRPIKGTVVRKRGMQEADADRLIEEQSTKEQTKKRKLPQESQKTDSQAPPENETMPLSTDSEDESEPDEKPSSSEDAQRDKLLQQYDKLQAEFEKLSEENAKLKRLQAESTKTSAPIKPAAASLSKPQLYMAIKKYVGPTMAALLRMEMFGGSEDRTWKDDEREFAIELLQLGEEVYKYCCDEWRFRLPSMRIARSWLEKKNTENSEEFLDL
ncbi:GD13349 [Drosophila simulans]|uniref:GD13349 n=1 Tax=Drosophila simulans TaxID=7240 RepID=B4QP40_DROSI|nr:GD13349 [Drosophila simulans]